MKQRIKRAMLDALSGATGRHAVLLGAQASREDGIAAVDAPYRVDGERLVLQIDEPGAGRLVATYMERGTDIWSTGEVSYAGPGTLELALATGEVRYAGGVSGSVSGGQPVKARRFDWRITLRDQAGVSRVRRTSHYVVRHGRGGEASYYEGEDYLDYEQESQAVHESIVALALEHRARGPVLEVGCATGGTLAALGAAGLEGYGLDLSEWAVSRATERLGPGRVWVCDVEHQEIPTEVRARGPFGVLVMASVFEHFARPFDVAQAMAALVQPGGLLLLITSNADSLTRRVFGSDWEGYFDWTHHGVDEVTPSAMRARMPGAGWRIASMHTWQVWDGSNDPTHASVREWFDADARFRRLLHERELGDFLTCVAVRT